MAYQPDKKSKLYGILGVVTFIATPIIFLLYGFAVNA